ncbi:MAG: SIR2 family protein [Muribaculaceae bacterium]|nr:SIR2 family protein [Muribaculaceae bacterium]
MIPVVEFSDISMELKDHIEKRRIIPVIGAGFTAGCKAKHGDVPSGDEMKGDMLRDIIKQEPEEDFSELETADIKKVAAIYKKIVPKNERIQYLQDRFTRVKLPQNRKDFINIEWNYIYTFNLDTAIEENGDHKKKIIANRPLTEKTIEQMENCVFKVHGDVEDYITYDDSKCYIMDAKEYIDSIKRNEAILTKMQQDFQNENLLFVGCSLRDELDILSLDFSYSQKHGISRYYITDQRPNRVRDLELAEYGITQVVLVNDYEEFYDAMNIMRGDAHIEQSETKNYIVGGTLIEPNTFEKDKDFLYFGRKLVSNQGKLSLPGFFVERKLVGDLVREMKSFCVQIVYGARVSGKTYILASMADKIKNRDVYFLDSRSLINEQTFFEFLEMKNAVICIDSNAVRKDLIFRIDQYLGSFEKNNTNIVLTINKSDKDVIYVFSGKEEDHIKLYELDSRFSKEEIEELNSRLSVASINKFNANKTLIDNLISVSGEKRNSILKKYKLKKDPSIAYVEALILLAIKERISTQEMQQYGLTSEFRVILNSYTPMIDEGLVDVGEKTSFDGSNYKMFINAKYWLLDMLGELAGNNAYYKKILEAYYNLVDSYIIMHPDSKYRNLEDYIRFDVLNEIFRNSSVDGNRRIIVGIYDELNTLLASEPQFYHQRAKCHLWYTRTNKREEEVRDALRYAKKALHDYKLDKHDENNVKVRSTIRHMNVTVAIAQARLASALNYADKEQFKDCIGDLYQIVVTDGEAIAFENRRERKQEMGDVDAFITYCQTNDLSTMNLSAPERKKIDIMCSENMRRKMRV